jgi:hypothetical protein
MKQHSTWFKRTMNPVLRRLFGVEITSIVMDGKVIGYGIRKQLK